MTKERYSTTLAYKRLQKGIVMTIVMTTTSIAMKMTTLTKRKTMMITKTTIKMTTIIIKKQQG